MYFVLNGHYVMACDHACSPLPPMQLTHMHVPDAPRLAVALSYRLVLSLHPMIFDTQLAIANHSSVPSAVLVK